MSPRVILLGGLIVGLVARVLFGLLDDGLWWPDEYYQSLEPAHRLVFGYGWQAWEFVEGARHWTLPGVVAAVMKAADLLGLPYLRVIELTFCAIGAATAYAVFVLACAQGASERAAAIAATVFSLMGLAVFIGPRPMGEGLSALPITVAFALLFGAPTRTRLVVAGALLAFAVGLRIQNGLFAVLALPLPLRRPGGRGHALVLLGTLGVGAALYGLVDLLTWGEWFHSARVYLRFNVVEGRASMFGTAPFFHYLTSFVTAEGVTIVPLALLSAIGAARARWLPLTIVVFAVGHSFIPHKELRFLFPIVPLLCAHAAVGLDLVKPWVQRATLGLAVLSLALLPTLTFGRLGIHDPPRATSAMDLGGPQNRLLQFAGKRSDVCGLRIEDFPHWRTGGFAYFHNPAPLYRAERPGEGAGHYNYVIARRGTVAGEELAVDHDVALLKLSGPCTPDPAYDWHLE